MTAYHLLSQNTPFTPPPGADNVQCPRSSKEFMSTLLCVFLPAAAIYGHLLHLQSGKRPKRPDILKFCAFLFLPALPLVQLVNNFSKACDGRWKDADLPYYASAVLGMRASTEQIEGISDDHTVHLYDVPPQLAQREETDRHGYFRAIHVLLAVILALPVAFDFVIYVKRYGEGVEGYANTAALGLDHRFGWMDLGSMLATMSTIIIILVLNHQWKVDVQPDRDEYENDMKRIKISVENRLYDILREACLAAAIQDYPGRG